MFVIIMSNMNASCESRNRMAAASAKASRSGWRYHRCRGNSGEAYSRSADMSFDSGHSNDLAEFLAQNSRTVIQSQVHDLLQQLVVPNPCRLRAIREIFPVRK